MTNAYDNHIIMASSVLCCIDSLKTE